MKPVKAWAVVKENGEFVGLRRDARASAWPWGVHDGRKWRVVRVEIREVPKKVKR